MDQRYKEWIAKYLETNNPYGKCHAAVDAMITEFPELTKIVGHVEDGHWGRRGHVWCTAPDGEIVDPTATQFPAVFEYEPWTPDSLVRVGKCMECGSEIWEKVPSLDAEIRKSACGKECEAALQKDWEDTMSEIKNEVMT
jgi:hypothetical protein